MRKRSPELVVKIRRRGGVGGLFFFCLFLVGTHLFVVFRGGDGSGLLLTG